MLDCPNKYETNPVSTIYSLPNASDSACMAVSIAFCADSSNARSIKCVPGISRISFFPGLCPVSTQPLFIHLATWPVIWDGPTLTRALPLLIFISVCKSAFNTPGGNELDSGVGSSVRSGAAAIIASSMTSPPACNALRIAFFASFSGKSFKAASSLVVSILSVISSAISV